VTCAFFFYVTVVILADMLAKLMKISGTLKQMVVAQFMKQLCCQILLFICMVFEFKIVAMSSAANCIISLPFADVLLNITVSEWNLDHYKLHTFAVNVTFVIFLNTE